MPVKVESVSISDSIAHAQETQSWVLLNVCCKAFCEFRTVYENDYLRVPYNNQK